MPAAIRPALLPDVPAIERVVRDAYRHYIARMAKPPGPMQDDYRARVAQGAAWVLEDAGAIVGVVVVLDAAGYLLLDNVAVDPARQGQGFGRRLIAFAESEARRRGYAEIRLYTHVTMVENQALYARLGFDETHRGTQAGFERVFMRKPLV